MLSQPLRARPRRARRGATLVFVALLLVVILGVCAFAIDLSRLYVGVNELQTAVDAAALRGALRLQRAPNADPTADVTDFLATSNPVMGTTLTDVTVQGWHWNADAGQRRPMAWGTTTGSTPVNAVSVAATLPAGLLFGRVLSVVAPRPRRTATAWVVSVGLTCVRPWMFELTRVFSRGGVTVTPRTTPTAENIASLRNNALSARVELMIAPPTVSNPAPGIYGTSVVGNWVGVDLPDRNFQSAMNTCNASAVTFPTTRPNAAANAGQHAIVVDRAEKNIEYKNAQNPNICPVFVGEDDRCNVTIPVMLGDTPAGVPFSTAGTDHTARLLTTFRLLCFKRSNLNPGNVRTACSEAPPTVNWRNVAPGTMYGFLDYALPSFSGQFALGTGGSTAQRLILVQ